jgi:hypothetical protein
MKMKGEVKYIVLVWLLLILLVISGCTPERSSYVVVPTPEGAYSVDVLFREFYDHLGGMQVLGPAISPIFSHENRKYQYVLAGCMEYNLDAAPSERFRLSPLGLELGLAEPSVPVPEEPGTVYIDGHVIYQGFVPLYRQLGGARFVGRPLTGVHYNQEAKRYEQYFENLGFYWMDNDPPEKISLLAYGAWKCDNKCRHQAPLSAQIRLPTTSTTLDEIAFREVIARLGSEFSGFALSDPYTGSDGKLEQVYENLVLVSNPDSPARVSLRPLPEKIGIEPGAMAEDNGVEGMVFWEIESGQGYNVPQPFLDYITLHGGMEVAGIPIGELQLVGDQVFRQCYTYLCLDYHLQSEIPQDLRIRPAPLGQDYLDLYYQSPVSAFSESQALRTISLQVWERYQFVSSDQSQEIGSSIFEGKTPLRSIEPILILTMPDGSQKSYYFPPTGDDGQTMLRLDPIEAQNGTLIPYEVCISSIRDEMFCVKDSFVIWYNPQ